MWGSLLSPSSTNTPRGSVSQRKDNKETVSGNVTEHHAFCRALPQQSLRIVTLMFIQFVAEQLLCQHPPVFFFSPFVYSASRRTACFPCPVCYKGSRETGGGLATAGDLLCRTITKRWSCLWDSEENVCTQTWNYRLPQDKLWNVSKKSLMYTRSRHIATLASTVFLNVSRIFTLLLVPFWSPSTPEKNICLFSLIIAPPHSPASVSC